MFSFLSSKGKVKEETEEKSQKFSRIWCLKQDTSTKVRF